MTDGGELMLQLHLTAAQDLIVMIAQMLGPIWM